VLSAPPQHQSISNLGHTTQHGLLQFSSRSRGVKSGPNFLNGRGRPNRTQVPSESPFFAERARTVASCTCALFLRIPCYVLLFFFTVLQKISPLCTRSPTQLARCSPRRLNINQSRISNEHNTPHGLLQFSSRSRSRGRSRARAQRSAFKVPVSTCTKLNAQRIFSMDADGPAAHSTGSWFSGGIGLGMSKTPFVSRGLFTALPRAAQATRQFAPRQYTLHPPVRAPSHSLCTAHLI
jgi:hypothetical protein